MTRKHVWLNLGGLGMLIALLRLAYLVECWVADYAGVSKDLLVHGFHPVSGSTLVSILR